MKIAAFVYFAWKCVSAVPHYSSIIFLTIPGVIYIACIYILYCENCIFVLYQIRRPLGLAFVIYFWWLGELLLLYI
jgi:hypothetical protein